MILKFGRINSYPPGTLYFPSTNPLFFRQKQSIPFPSSLTLKSTCFTFSATLSTVRPLYMNGVQIRYNWVTRLLPFILEGILLSLAQILIAFSIFGMFKLFRAVYKKN